MSTSLSALFSDESKAVFARTEKPKEFTSKRAPKAPEVAKKEKKPKHKRRRPDDDNTAEVEPSGIAESVGEISTGKLDSEKDSRTLFVGNISVTTTSKTMRQDFSKFGEIESLRLRSVPVAGTAVDDHGNLDLVKKVCANSQKFGTQKGSLNAYIVYKSPAGVTAAIALDNTIYGGRHIRVDRMTPTMYDPKRSVFLGGLPFFTDEEELRNHFAQALPNGQDDIDGIRVVRDPDTLMGKGIGYLCLKNHDAVSKALTLNESKFKKRKIRVTTCGKRTKRTERAKQIVVATAVEEKKEVDADGLVPTSTASVSSAVSEAPKSRKRKAPASESPAVRRMKMKRALAQEAKKIKNNNARGGKKPKGKKQLGGVIKTVIRMSKKAGKK